MDSGNALSKESETKKKAKSVIHGEPSEASCVSMKSDESMGKPPLFSETDSPADVSVIHGEPPEASCVSMKSNESMGKPPLFSESPADVRNKQEELKLGSNSTKKQLDTIYKELEDKIISLMKKELESFKKILSPDYPACSETVDEGHSRVRDSFLKITLHILKKMNQRDLANTLQTKLAPLYLNKHKSSLKDKIKRIHEGISNQGSTTLLQEVYTELYITEGGSGEINNEHEVRQIEAASRRPEIQETPIKCNDIFKALPGQDKAIRTVLTKGVSGIGKTVSVQKFILDWAEGNANQDVHFIFPLSFRELNLIKEKNLSLMQLLRYSFKDIKELRSTDLEDFKVMFIFDGLDECRFPLDFLNNQSLSDVTETTSVDMLLTNLIKGNLLPSALLWITSRPAAANQIPPECIEQVTDVRGFNDPQKDEYFRKRIHDKSLAKKVIEHIKSSRSLYIMCHIPVFCWISATVLERMLSDAKSAEIPKTLTQMFTHFLIFQIKLKSQKYDGKYEVDSQKAKESIQSLGQLAFRLLEKENLVFYEDDMRECGIDVREASVYSGVCTQIFREEFGLHLGKVYSFVHVSIQEFIAALYVFLVFVHKATHLFTFYKSTISDFLKKGVDMAMQSKNGHMDLFLRFLLGLSLESNQKMLHGLFTQTESSSHSSQEVVDYIKQKIRENPSSEKSINLFHCLNELNDHSLVQEVQMYLSEASAKQRCGIDLSHSQWSALVFILLNSEEELNQFTLSKYNRSEKCLLRLLPVVKASTNANLSCCYLTEKGCSALASVLSSSFSNLRALNLSHNKLQDSGVQLLSAGLKNHQCNLEILKLYDCSIGQQGYAVLASALGSNPSHLRELDLNNNEPGDSGVKLLSHFLSDPHCKLEKLHLSNCSIGHAGFAALASALRSNPSHLRELNLSCNKPGDSGVKLLSHFLEDPHCKLEKLQLSNNCFEDKGFAALASALRSNPSHLRELNLSCNKLGDSGVKLLSHFLEDPCCQLKKLELSNCSIKEERCAALASALKLNPSHLRELDLHYNNIGDSGMKLLSDLIEDPHCKLEKLQLYNCHIGAPGCAALFSALRTNPLHLKELDLRCNKPESSGIKLLSYLLKDPNCKLEILHLSSCSIGEDGCDALILALSSNTSHLRKLNLRENKLGDSGGKLLLNLLRDPHNKLEKLNLV